MSLKSLDPVQPTALLHHHGHLVHLPELLGGGEDVGEPVQHHAHGLVVLGSQEVTERLQNSLEENRKCPITVNSIARPHLSTQVDDLLDVAAAGEIGDGPGSFLLSLEVPLDEDIDERLQTAGINHGLDLDRVAGGDVGDGPGALLQ